MTVLPAGAAVRRPLAGKQKQRTANAGSQSNIAEAKMSSMGKENCKAKAKVRGKGLKFAVFLYVQFIIKLFGFVFLSVLLKLSAGL